jgi:hypothetical protein
MSTLYTSLLQRLLQASNAQDPSKKTREPTELDLLGSLMNMVQAQENIIKSQKYCQG